MPSKAEISGEPEKGNCFTSTGFSIIKNMRNILDGLENE
jgi:hypothetical protein